MVLVNNDQSAVAVDTRKLKKEAQKVLSFLGYADFDLGILLATDEQMHQFNMQYRHKDKPTDILSFPFHPHAKPDTPLIAESEDEKNLGDLIFAPLYITNDLERWGQTFDTRLQTLLVHGICHLLGYDHETDADYAIMNQKELELLVLLNGEKK